MQSGGSLIDDKVFTEVIEAVYRLVYLRLFCFTNLLGLSSFSRVAILFFFYIIWQLIFMASYAVSIYPDYNSEKEEKLGQTRKLTSTHCIYQTGLTE